MAEDSKEKFKQFANELLFIADGAGFKSENYACFAMFEFFYNRISNNLEDYKKKGWINDTTDNRQIEEAIFAHLDELIDIYRVSDTTPGYPGLNKSDYYDIFKKSKTTIIDMHNRAVAHYKVGSDSHKSPYLSRSDVAEILSVKFENTNEEREKVRKAVEPNNYSPQPGMNLYGRDKDEESEIRAFTKIQRLLDEKKYQIRKNGLGVLGGLFGTAGSVGATIGLGVLAFATPVGLAAGAAGMVASIFGMGVGIFASSRFSRYLRKKLRERFNLRVDKYEFMHGKGKYKLDEKGKIKGYKEQELKYLRTLERWKVYLLVHDKMKTAKNYSEFMKWFEEFKTTRVEPVSGYKIKYIHKENEKDIFHDAKRLKGEHFINDTTDGFSRTMSKALAFENINMQVDNNGLVARVMRLWNTQAPTSQNIVKFDDLRQIESHFDEEFKHVKSIPELELVAGDLKNLEKDFETCGGDLKGKNSYKKHQSELSKIAKNLVIKSLLKDEFNSNNYKYGCRATKDTLFSDVLNNADVGSNMSSAENAKEFVSEEFGTPENPGRLFMKGLYANEFMSPVTKSLGGSFIDQLHFETAKKDDILRQSLTYVPDDQKPAVSSAIDSIATQLANATTKEDLNSIVFSPATVGHSSAFNFLDNFKQKKLESASLSTNDISNRLVGVPDITSTTGLSVKNLIANLTYDKLDEGIEDIRNRITNSGLSEDQQKKYMNALDEQVKSVYVKHVNMVRANASNELADSNGGSFVENMKTIRELTLSSPSKAAAILRQMQSANVSEYLVEKFKLKMVSLLSEKAYNLFNSNENQVNIKSITSFLKDLSEYEKFGTIDKWQKDKFLQNIGGNISTYLYNYVDDIHINFLRNTGTDGKDTYPVQARKILENDYSQAGLSEYFASGTIEATKYKEEFERVRYAGTIDLKSLLTVRVNNTDILEENSEATKNVLTVYFNKNRKLGTDKFLNFMRLMKNADTYAVVDENNIENVSANTVVPVKKLNIKNVSGEEETTLTSGIAGGDESKSFYIQMEKILNDPEFQTNCNSDEQMAILIIMKRRIHAKIMAQMATIFDKYGTRSGINDNLQFALRYPNVISDIVNRWLPLAQDVDRAVAIASSGATMTASGTPLSTILGDIRSSNYGSFMTSKELER